MVGPVAQSELTGQVHFELATPADDADIRRLLRENPMPGRISLSLEREPDASIAAAVEGDVHHTIVARDASDGPIVAMGSVAVRTLHVNGEPTHVGYLSQLRLDRRHRPRASIVRDGYTFFDHEVRPTLDATHYFTSIAADNRVARRLLERGLPGMPRYRPLDTFVTSLIESCGAMRRLAPGLHVRWAGLDDWDEILACLDRNGARFQFVPAWREDAAALTERVRSEEITFFIATRRDRVVGCMAVWDQSAYKQAVVRGYEPRLLRWRGLINVAGRFTGTPELPPIGTRLNMAYLSHVAVDNDDPNVFASLLARACNPGDGWFDDGARGYFVLGLSQRHPLLAAIPRHFRRHAYATTLYSVHFGDSIEAIDGRPCQPEVALL